MHSSPATIYIIFILSRKLELDSFREPYLPFCVVAAVHARRARPGEACQCDDHFGTKFETRNEDAGAQLVFSCQLWQLSDNVSELHDQARQLRIQNAYSSRDTKEQARSSAISCSWQATSCVVETLN